jgi:DnaJ family protein C protein 8
MADDADAEDKLNEFLGVVAKVETESDEWTTDKQIARLTRPGAKYFNLNPFEVLMCTPQSTDAQIKKNFRRLSILLHPDKVDAKFKDNAEVVFEALNKAYKQLNDPEEKKTCDSIASESTKRAEKFIKDKKKELKKKLGIENPPVPEENPEEFEKLVKKNMCKIFAEIQTKKEEIEQREQMTRKREKEEEQEEVQAREEDEKFHKQWTDKRERRIDNWRDFAGKDLLGKSAASGGVIKKHKKNKLTKPPSMKMEQRAGHQRDSFSTEAQVHMLQKKEAGWEEKLLAEKGRSDGRWKGAW